MFIINGQIDDVISAQDRGLHYGDGVFETIAVQKNNLLCWESHYQRLKTGCERLGMDCPADTLLLSEFDRFENTSELAVLKIIITRGQGGRGYRPPVGRNTSITRILGIYPWPDYPEKNYTDGVSIRFCQTRLGQNPHLAGIKHLNRLEQVLARAEWDNPDIAEALMLDTDDNVIAGTMSNLFIIKDKTLMTPDISRTGINGIIRQNILGFAPSLGLSVKIIQISTDDLDNADELFLSNSIIGIWAIKSLDSQNYQPGAWTHKIRNKLIEQKIIVR